MNVRLAVAAALLLVSCAPWELKPDDGSSITLEFTERENGAGARGFVVIFMDDYDCFGNSKSGTAATAMPITKTMPVPGRKYLSIQSSYFGISLGSTQSCQATYTFPIEAGGRYSVAIGNDGSRCYTRVSRLTADAGSGGKPVQLIQRTPLRAFSGGGPWCTEDAAFAGSSSLLVPRGK